MLRRKKQIITTSRNITITITLNNSRITCADFLGAKCYKKWEKKVQCIFICLTPCLTDVWRCSELREAPPPPQWKCIFFLYKKKKWKEKWQKITKDHIRASKCRWCFCVFVFFLLLAHIIWHANLSPNAYTIFFRSKARKKQLMWTNEKIPNTS